jgi:hypothetical protein
MEAPMGCMTTHSKANITLMSAKSKVLQSDIHKLQNYSILGYHCLFILFVLYLMTLLVAQTIQGEKKFIHKLSVL